MTGTATLAEVKHALGNFNRTGEFDIRGNPERDGRVEVWTNAQFYDDSVFPSERAYLARQIEEGVDRWAVVVADEYVKGE